MLDAHAHLPETLKEKGDLPENYSAVVCATKESEFSKLTAFARAFPKNIIPAFGLHPWFLNERSAEWEKNLRSALEENLGAHVGEIGLDKMLFHKIPAKEQVEVFERQLDLAEEFSAPVEIHCVRAWGEMMQILRGRQMLVKLHFHDFSGSAEIARELEKMGATFSFPQRRIENPTVKLTSVLNSLSKEKVFFESDTPVPLS